MTGKGTRDRGAQPSQSGTNYGNLEWYVRHFKFQSAVEPYD
jgi:hypothetical protein